MEKILVDTDILIEFFRIKDRSLSLYSKIFRINTHIPMISSVTIAELFAGRSIQDKREEAILKEFLSKVEILYSNFEVMKLTGEIMRSSDYKATFQDAEIASCALYYELPLLTKNVKDFCKILGLKLFDENG